MIIRKREIRQAGYFSHMTKPHDELLIFELNDQKDCFRLLMLLHNHGKLYSEKIRRLGMNDRTIIKVRNVLLKFDLISVDSLDGSRRKYHALTSKGQRVVEKLIELERELLID
jgi:predicted transcriptional regulator